jgi:hypothetical protein
MGYLRYVALIALGVGIFYVGGEAPECEPYGSDGLCRLSVWRWAYFAEFHQLCVLALAVGIPIGMYFFREFRDLSARAAAERRARWKKAERQLPAEGARVVTDWYGGVRSCGLTHAEEVPVNKLPGDGAQFAPSAPDQVPLEGDRRRPWAY